jgi:hypothetical protein
MPDNSEKPTPIQPPQPHRIADLARAAAKGALGTVPLAGSLLAEAADLGLPNPAEQDRRRWEGDITDGVNSLHERMDGVDRHLGEPNVRLSAGAAIAATYLIEQCPDGLGHQYIGANAIVEANPGSEPQDILDGLGELESYGLLEPMDGVGCEGIYCLNLAGYVALDLPLMGWDTNADARAIAAWALTQGSEAEVGDLEAAMDWPTRRLNPALGLVLRCVEDENISREMQPAYVTSYFYMSSADRARLRRFSKQM